LDEDFGKRSESNSTIKEMVAAIRTIAATLIDLGDKYD
jgi:hypothetical protein